MLYIYVRLGYIYINKFWIYFDEYKIKLFTVKPSSSYDISLDLNQSSKDIVKNVQDTKVWTATAIKLLIENRGDAEQDFNSNKKKTIKFGIKYQAN